ncbi:MAG: class I SAM-dependent DNA methyltransferase [Bryobacteraceae bacterium]
MPRRSQPDVLRRLQPRQQVWNYCNLLRDDGVSYGDYVEQLTYLLFLKMDYERTRPPYNKKSTIPEDYNWASLIELDGLPLERHYRNTLENLGKEPGLLGIIFRKAQNKIQNPAHLRRLIVDLIDKEPWSALSADVKGDIYEGLLEKNAQDTKSGAGQYFTPRALIDAIVEVMRPQPGTAIIDPAAGTGGFLLSAASHILKEYKLDRDQVRHLQTHALYAVELVASTARLCAMNLLMHGLGNEKNIAAGKDSLAAKPSANYDMVLTNPPSGKKSSVTIINQEGGEVRERQEILRDDFWATTGNKQLNFLQHVRSLLKINGRAAIVLPDNVLFEGGAGETIRKRLLHDCDVHALLRLPTGIFYAQGVKANVLFFDRKPASETPWNRSLWIYDLRTNKHFTLKTNTLTRADLDDFVHCYNPANRHQRRETERSRRFSYEDLVKRDKANLDLFWLRDDSLGDSSDLPDPAILAAEIVEDLQAALDHFAQIAADLAAGERHETK